MLQIPHLNSSVSSLCSSATMRWRCSRARWGRGAGGGRCCPRNERSTPPRATTQRCTASSCGVQGGSASRNQLQAQPAKWNAQRSRQQDNIQIPAWSTCRPCLRGMQGTCMHCIPTTPTHLWCLKTAGCALHRCRTLPVTAAPHHACSQVWRRLCRSPDRSVAGLARPQRSCAGRKRRRLC